MNTNSFVVLRSLFFYLAVLNLCPKVSELKSGCWLRVQIAASTCSGDGSVVHEDHRVSCLYKLDAMSAKDPGLPPEQLHHTFLHEMLGHVGVDSSQRIIEEVDVFVLSSDQKSDVRSHSWMKGFQNNDTDYL